MAENEFGQGSGLIGDDFSLASGIDEISYDDPFNNNGNDCSGDIASKKCESVTIHDPALNNKKCEASNLRKEPPKIIGDSCLFGTSNEKRKMGQSVGCEIESSLCSSTCEDPTRNIEQNLLARTKISPSAQNIIDLKRRKKYSSTSILKPEHTAVKAHKMSTKNMIKPSKSDGLLTLALKAKYRNTTAQQFASNRDITMSSSSDGYSSRHTSALDGMGDEREPSLGKANASWYCTSGSQSEAHQYSAADPNYYRSPIPQVKSSSMHNLLLQSKAQCKSQILLRQSSAHSLLKRNSFQSIKNVDEKLDLSSLLPAKRRTKSRRDSRKWSFPNAASVATESDFTKNSIKDNEDPAQSSINDMIGDQADSLLHEACRLFPNSDTVVETALRVDPDAVRRSVVVTNDQEGYSTKKTNSSMYGYPINLALTHGANEKILKLLVQSGADVLAFKDGTNCGASLGTALSSKYCNLAIVDLLLSANQQCAKISDRRGNFPLHIAVSYGRSIDIVTSLFTVYPEAQAMRNFHSQTPLDIAIQSTRCPEEVTDFLRSVACRTSSHDKIVNATRIDSNQTFTYLEDGLDDIMEINC